MENNIVPPIESSQNLPITDPNPIEQKPRGNAFLLTLTFLLILSGIFGVWYFSHPLLDDDFGTATTDQFAGWKTYRSDQYGFEFKYPENLVSKGKSINSNNVIQVGYASMELASSSPENGLTADLVFNIFENPKHLAMKDYFTNKNNYFWPDVFTSSTTMQTTVVDGRNAVYYNVESEYDFKEIILNDNYRFIRVQDFGDGKFVNQILSTFKFISTSTSAVDMSGWETYTNSQYGFEFKYPQNFSVTLDSYGNVSVMDLRENYFDLNFGVLTKWVSPADSQYIEQKTDGYNSNNILYHKYFQILGSSNEYHYFLMKDKSLGVDASYTHERSNDIGLSLNPNEKEFNQILSTFKFTK